MKLIIRRELLILLLLLRVVLHHPAPIRTAPTTAADGAAFSSPSAISITPTPTVPHATTTGMRLSVVVM